MEVIRDKSARRRKPENGAQKSARQRHKTRHRIQKCASQKCKSKVQDVGFDKFARQKFMTLDSTKV